MAGQYR
jgi:hypothetical protein